MQLSQTFITLLTLTTTTIALPQIITANATLPGILNATETHIPLVPTINLAKKLDTGGPAGSGTLATALGLETVVSDEVLMTVSEATPTGGPLSVATPVV
ncbi:uncharacterized protein GGS25DRAFT_501609 [Hypoxylon fragiforme]|uniref:uncharacterized protein n=1 Tax=Hypoxylon fragiforme TaxID=63214 RepID=UPI0020C6A999|nr:uncharacterized protein GGS25DRAFT_501609 [Hypoxylon fragiforme]KAI2606513.1 hypothetical protein GGS25DRAFT_501609 [Hypoxylon fragiforme]